MLTAFVQGVMLCFVRPSVDGLRCFCLAHRGHLSACLRSSQIGEIKTVSLELKAGVHRGKGGSNAAEELVERLDGALSLDLAAQLVVKAGGDLDRAEHLLQNVPRTRAMNDLLMVLKEFVFVGQEPIKVSLDHRDGIHGHPSGILVCLSLRAGNGAALSHR